MDTKDFREIVSTLVKHYLVQTNGNNLMPTRRFRNAVKAYRNNYQASSMKPLKDNNDIPI